MTVRLTPEDEAAIERAVAHEVAVSHESDNDPGRPARLESLYAIALRGAANQLRLTRAEARAILDACNGLHLTDALLGQHARAEVADCEGLGEKWWIDQRDLVRRLRDLPLPLSAALEIWTSDFWASDRLNDPEWEAEHLAKVVR